MKIICIGRNYQKHALELNNPVPSSPMIFMKPSTALLVNNKPLYYPEFTKDLHYEVEVVLKICKNGRHVVPEFADSYFEQIGLGIDFTARDLQNELKAKGHPWELAKAFDNSAAISDFLDKKDITTNDGIIFSLQKNGQIVQEGNTTDLIFSFNTLICYISKYFKLHVGDLIYTGTPAGVGPVKIGDTLTGFIGDRQMLTCEIK